MPPSFSKTDADFIDILPGLKAEDSSYTAHAAFLAGSCFNAGARAVSAPQADAACPAAKMFRAPTLDYALGL
jgi:hypothetical protein